MRIVLDTTVLISALRSEKGAAAVVLGMALERRFVLLMDYRIACEYRDVALREQHVERSRFSFEEILQIIAELERIAEEVDIEVRHRPLSFDPGDDLTLDAAINGRCDVIVTSNLRHIAGPAELFGIEAMNAGAFLTRMRTGGS